MIFDATITEKRREALLVYLKEQSFERVIDLGGCMDPWAREYVTHYVDLIDPYEYLPKYNVMCDLIRQSEVIRGDLDSLGLWDELAKVPPFDFAICSQTLEHLSNPRVLLENVPRIAERGFVSTPNKFAELRRGVHWGHDFRGFLPHRWICSVKDGVFWMFPKLNFIECIKGLEWADSASEEVLGTELSFVWKEDIPYKIVSDMDIGLPDPMPAIKYYVKELKVGL